MKIKIRSYGKGDRERDDERGMGVREGKRKRWKENCVKEREKGKERERF